MKTSAFMIFFLFTLGTYSFAQKKADSIVSQPTSHLTDVQPQKEPTAKQPTVSDGHLQLSDKQITTKVRAKISADKALAGYKLNVTTQDGVVMLNGTVKSDTDASALVEIVQSTEGVRDVGTTGIHIENSKQPFTDIMITAKIKGTYLREKLQGKDIPAVNVSVETNNGVVYLSGSVDNKAQADNAMSLAKSVTGVKEVHSRIKVTGVEG